MAGWTSDELNKIGKAEELDLMSMRQDETLRKPVTIWVVRVGDDLYVRAYKGRSRPWFRGAQTRHEGRIRAGGVEKDVTFVEVEGDSTANDRIDAEYRRKYRRYAANVLDPMLTPTARPATLKLEPR